MGLGASWVRGGPPTRAGGGRLLVGAIVFVGTLQFSLMEGSAIGGVVAALAFVVIVSAFVHDGTPDRSG